MMMTVVGDPDPAGRPDLFGDLVAAARPRRSGFAAPVSLGVHAVALTLVVLFSVSRLDPQKLKHDPMYIPILGPPPAPLPQLPKGSGESQRPRQPAPDPRPVVAFTVPLEAPPVETPAPAEALADASGSPVGADDGIDEGSEVGKPGGLVGGVPWGVTGGVVDGTGEVPVANPDHPPRPLHKVRPEYPQPAFVQKVQGTVMVRIVIGAEGRVVDAIVTQSVPLLDEAALAAVRQWRFAPAVKGGRPVASFAFVPVEFRLY